MLTLSTIKNSSGAAKYYAKEDNYYLVEVDAKEASLWFGKGASELGLKGKVEEKRLQEVFEGKLPNGLTIGLQKDGKPNHRPGYDLCFHAPKSVSILALDGEDKRFYTAHLEAVKETLKIIERDCAQSKIFKDGKARFENTKNLTVALVRHTASRELDPHLHHHALVINATKRSDNAWRALASSRVKDNKNVNGFSERVYKNQIYYGLIYRNYLANKVLQLGCEIEVVGKHGMWEIKGIPKAAIDLMSKRRKQIEERLGELNYQSLKAADVAAKATREAKSKDLKLSDIKKNWREELNSIGFSSEKFLKQLNSKELESTNKLTNDFTDKFINKLTTETTQEITKKITKETVKDAIRHLSQYSLKLDYSKIISQALEFSIGKITHRDIVDAMEYLIKDSFLIPLNKDDSMFVTRELIEKEEQIIDLVANGKNGDFKIALKRGEVSKIINDTVKGYEGIDSPEKCINKQDNLRHKKTVQKAAAILQSKGRLSLVEYKDQNNTDFMSAVLKLAESSGKTVRILSPNRMITNDINESIKRNPNNVWQWLVSLGKPEIGDSVAGFRYKYQREFDLPSFLLRFKEGKDVVLVNNAELLGCDDVLSLLELAEKSKAKLIFLNSTNRLGFGAGKPLETLKQAGIEQFRIDGTINKHVCKIDENAVVIINKISENPPELRAVKDDHERINELAKEYVNKYVQNDRDLNNAKKLSDVVVLVSSKKQLRKTNEAIRQELKARGKISCNDINDVEHVVSVLNPVYMSKPESTFAHRYQKNMVIRAYGDRGGYQDWNIDGYDRNTNILSLVQYKQFGDGKQNQQIKQNKQSKQTKQIKRRTLWNPRSSGKQIQNHMVFKREELDIATGDKLIATSNMRSLGIKNGTRFIISEVADQYIRLSSIPSVNGSNKTNKINKVNKINKAKVFKINISNLKGSHFQYDYATTLNKSLKNPVDHIIGDFKAYALNQADIIELVKRSKKH